MLSLAVVYFVHLILTLHCSKAKLQKYPLGNSFISTFVPWILKPVYCFFRLLEVSRFMVGIIVA